MTKENKYIIHEDCIEYTFYNLFFSSLHTNRKISLDRVNAIDLNTSPHSLIIDNREIVFLNHDDTKSLEAFATKNKIPYSTHIDTWAILTRDYLDTQPEEKTIGEQDRELAAAGIDNKTFKKINREIWWTMFGTMEWTYLGLWDLLAMKQYRNPIYSLYGRKYYWRVMEIALKGSEYKRS